MAVVILPKVVTKASAEPPRGPTMEAGVNEYMREMEKLKAMCGDGKYRAITEGETARMTHEGAESN